MFPRPVFVTGVIVVAVLVAIEHAQTPQPRPQFRSGVEYVQVDVRVVDEKGEPVHDLKQQDFKVFEDGAPQDLKTFSIVDLPLPDPSARPLAASLGVKPDVATNVRPAERGRTYLIVFDALLVAPCQTLVVRKLLREFIERSVGPEDLVAIVSTGLDRSFQNFTNDKSRLLAIVGSLIGQAPPGPTVGAAQDVAGRAERATGISGKGAGRPNPPIGDVIMNEPRQALLRLLGFVQAMSASGDGSKAIILVSESVPFDLTFNTEGLSSQGSALLSDVQRVSTAARQGNVPIYPLSPRGLTDGADCEADGGVFPAIDLLQEIRLQEANLRALADDAGGVPIVGTNDLSGGLRRVVALSSYYYQLGFDSSNTKADGKVHRIVVSVTRPGARVVSRKGYAVPRPADAKAIAALAGPPGSSAELRESLNAALPVTDLPISVTAAAFRQAGGKGISAAVVVETLGRDLAWSPAGVLTMPIELTAVALEGRGTIKTGDWGRMQPTEPAETSARVRNFGLRWLARLDDLKPGRYQIRAAISNGPSKQGSVWYDLDIPDFSKTPLAMSDVVLASVVASQRLTLRPDKVLAAVLPAPATTLRQFLPADALAIYAEVYDNDPQLVREIETSVVVIDAKGEEKSRDVKRQTATDGVVRIQLRLPLAKLEPGAYTLAVEARQTANRAISAGRALPFQIVDAGNK